MGRRKIEIQPITHERNRSVTFLKRKNGLFKKAYELGVLCSVDVAVIIFEERPGHPVKLYQYCSSNIENIVSRHQRHDGERDSRGPADFAGGNPVTKNEESYDDEVDDEDDVLLPKRKRPNDGKFKPGSGYGTAVGGDGGYGVRPQASISHNSGLPLHSTGSIDRHSPIGTNLQALSGLKRPRIPTISTQSRHDVAPRNPNSSSSVSTSYEYQSPSSASPFRHPPLQGQPDYSTHFPVSTPSPASSSSYMPIASESFSSSSRSSQPPPSRGAGAGSGGFPPRSSSSYDTAAGIYNTSMRHSHSSGTSGNGSTSLFNFLDHPDSSHSRNQTSPGFPNIDWPVHNTSSTSQSSGRRDT